MKVIAWYREYDKEFNYAEKSKVFDSVTSASNFFKIPKKRIQICIDTGTKWKGVMFDEAME